MDIYESIVSELKSYNSFIGELLLNEPLGKKSTFKIGGTAKLFIAPQNYISFIHALELLKQKDVRFYITGGCSNIVFPDNEYEGVILSTNKFNDVEIFNPDDCSSDFGPIQLKKNQILVTAFSGTPVASIVNFCTKNNISGMEEFAGLPGSIGGAAFMNARCFNKSISDVLFSTTYMDYTSSNITLNHTLYKPEDYDYKKSPFQNKNFFVTTVTLLLTKMPSGSIPKIEEKCKFFINERTSKGHYKFPSAGSVFKNNHDFGKPSGQIIDECGLKGFQIGGAQIAPFHGNFIINVNHATQKDIKDLVSYIQKTVFDKFGFTLSPEILFI